MREFKNKGIYCAVLANSQGSSQMSFRKMYEAYDSIESVLATYDIKSFTDEDPYISVNEKYLNG